MEATAPQLFQLALQHQQSGRLHDAEACYRRMLALDPDNAEANDNLGHVLIALGRAGDAEHHYRRAIALNRGSHITFNNLGNVLLHSGRMEEAVHSYRQALALDPGVPDIHLNLGIALSRLGRLAEAEKSYRGALSINPDNPTAHNDLGVLLTKLGRIDEAEHSYRRALALEPGFAEAHDNLGSLVGYTARLDEAVHHYRQALALKPDFVKAHNHLLFSLNSVPGLGPAEIYAEHREFDRRFSQQIAIRPHRNDPHPERRLRIGYVSGDFRGHAVAFFVEPVLARHDGGQFEIFCYYNFSGSDAVTERLRTCAHHWRAIDSLSDDAFAELVRADQIDILVDLSGHTEGNRLTAFARKPAPVQATWLGYLNTTGLAAMDYRITDANASPEGPLDALHSEKLVRLPDSQWCYRPPAGSPDVSPPPGAASGRITFASFTSPGKIGQSTIELWARLLARVPRSRLLVQLGGLDSAPSGYAERFAQRGIAKERVDFVASMPLRDHLALHGSADIMLDTTPCSGGTTTCHALWMGVPVVTLAGETATSRGGASLLHAVGLGQLVAQTPEQYLDIAAGLAADPEHLAALRASMRQRMSTSPLMDEARFTRNLEKAYRAMWRRWCAAQR